MKRIIALIICLLLVCGCMVRLPETSESEVTAPGSISEQGSQQHPERSWMDNWCDVGGNKVETDWNNIKSVNLSYAIGWNFDNEEYRQLRAGDRFDGYEINHITSTYLVAGETGFTCVQNDISLDGMRANHLQGVLKASKEGMTFYPYPSQTGENFMFLTACDDEFKKYYTDKSQLKISDSRTVAVQPIGIGFAYWVHEMLVGKISEFITGTATLDLAYLQTLEEPVFLDAKIKFSELKFTALATNQGDPFRDTVGSGVVLNSDTVDIVIGGYK